MTTARLIFLVAFLAPTAAWALDEPPCLSLGEVHGGYPRYHIINGRQCWYAATAPLPKPGQAKPAPAGQAAGIDVNPYGDPAWGQSDAKAAPAKPRPAKPAAVGGPLVIVPPAFNAR